MARYNYRRGSVTLAAFVADYGMQSATSTNASAGHIAWRRRISTFAPAHFGAAWLRRRLQWALHRRIGLRRASLLHNRRYYAPDRVPRNRTGGYPILRCASSKLAAASSVLLPSAILGDECSNAPGGDANTGEFPPKNNVAPQ